MVCNVFIVDVLGFLPHHGFQLATGGGYRGGVAAGLGILQVDVYTRQPYRHLELCGIALKEIMQTERIKK